jgi:transposase
MVLPARIVLAAADGTTNTAIAQRHRVHVDTVRKWRRRFWPRRLDGLADARRAGRPRRFTAVQTAQVKALACELPAMHGVPLSRWSATELADEAVSAGIVDDISASTVARWLAADASKPWRHRSWIFPRDPDFATRAGVVLDLYDGVWQGEPLGEGDYVRSADEKTSIQARCRCHPSLPPGLARLTRVEHEYDRRRCPGLPGRPRRARRHGDRPLRTINRHRIVRRPGRAGHDMPAVCLSPTGVLGRGQRLVAPRPGRR